MTTLNLVRDRRRPPGAAFGPNYRSSPVLRARWNRAADKLTWESLKRRVDASAADGLDRRAASRLEGNGELRRLSWVAFVSLYGATP